MVPTTVAKNTVRMVLKRLVAETTGSMAKGKNIRVGNAFMNNF